MKPSIPDSNKRTKKSPGRPQTPRGAVEGVLIGVRFSAEEVARIDAWIAEQKERHGIKLSRPAAIRAWLNMDL